MDNLIWFTAGMLAAGLLDWWLIVGSRWKRKEEASPSASMHHWPPRPESSVRAAGLSFAGMRSKPQRSTPPESPQSGAQTWMPSSSARPGGILWPSEITVTHSVSGNSGLDGRERVKTYSIPSSTSESPCACESCAGASGAAEAGVAPTSSGLSDCKCGHGRRDHIYDEGACRPGFECREECREYRPLSPGGDA